MVKKIKKGILWGARTYLIGQMQYWNGAPWRTYVERYLRRMGVIVFNPYNHPFIDSTLEDSDARSKLNRLMKQGRYDEIGKVVKKIRCEDLRMVDCSDFLFAYLNPEYPTCGAWEEFFWGNRMKKPIFFVVEGGKAKCPLWVFGTIPHKYIYNTIDDALDMLYNIDSGEVKIDSERWRLFRPEFLSPEGYLAFSQKGNK